MAGRGVPSARIIAPGKPVLSLTSVHFSCLRYTYLEVLSLLNITLRCIAIRSRVTVKGRLRSRYLKFSYQGRYVWAAIPCGQAHNLLERLTLL